ncbi:MAG: FtsX-like permease family protein [Acidobacteria bacterium]|nr:FtsX-like permease family protein [Acidobacteriota bacterium]
MNPPRFLPHVASITYRVLLLAYPAEFRREFAELPGVFAAACQESYRLGGLGAVVRRFIRALVDVPRHGLRDRFAPPQGRRPDDSPPTWAEWFSGLAADFRYAYRSLISRPGLTVAVAATLALGIGANTAIFSVVDATLLARSPWPDAERMVDLTVKLEATGGGGFAPTVEELIRWRDELDVFERLEARAGAPSVLIHVDGSRRVPLELVTPGYLGALGVRPIMGRLLSPEDGESDAAAVVILPESLWRQLYRADPAILGREVELAGKPYIVVGVVPAVRGMEQKLFAVLPSAGPETLTRRAAGVGWLRPGVSLEAARAQVEVMAQGEDERLGPYVGSLAPRRNVFWQQDDFRTGLLSILVAVFLVLTIACVNVANLMLTNLGRRRGEFAVRAAIGASRGRLVRFVLAESAILAILGGGFGLLVARGAIAAMQLIRPGGNLATGLDAVRLDARVMAYAIAVSALTAVLFGLVPALRRSGQPSEALQAAAFGRGTVSTRLGGALVAAETSLAVILLIGAALMFQNFLGLRFTDPGFDADRVLSIGVGLPSTKYPDRETQMAMLDTLALEITRVPGVEAAQYGQGAVPPQNMAMAGEMVVGEAEPRSFPETVTLLSHVQAGYFEFMGIALVAGRDFVEADYAAGDDAPERAAVITVAMAEKFWPGGDALGAMFRFERDYDQRWNRVVGIAAPTAHVSFEARGGELDLPHLYLPLVSDPRYMDLMIRLRDGVAPPTPEIRAAFARLDPGLPTEDIDSSAARLVAALHGPRFRAALFGAFGIVAITLAAVGIFGVVAHGAAQRQREMAIRMALGARPRGVLRLVVRQGLTPVLIGLMLGTGASLALGRLIASLLHQMSPTEPAVYLATLAGFFVVAVLATWIPARRAIRLDVMENLRSD